MRKQDFTGNLLSTTRSTYERLGQKPATWGEQDFLNTFARSYENAIEVLPCGCNYQWQGSRREAKCGRQPITIAHGW